MTRSNVAVTCGSPSLCRGVLAVLIRECGESVAPTPLRTSSTTRRHLAKSSAVQCNFVTRVSFFGFVHAVLWLRPSVFKAFQCIEVFFPQATERVKPALGSLERPSVAILCYSSTRSIQMGSSNALGTVRTALKGTPISTVDVLKLLNTGPDQVDFSSYPEPVCDLLCREWSIPIEVVN
jgi:hypothetical protein